MNETKEEQRRTHFKIAAVIGLITYMTVALYGWPTTRTIGLLPGQSYRLTGAQSVRRIEIHSVFPVTVTKGDCRAAQVTRSVLTCNNDADTVTVSDSRHILSPSNSVSVRYSRVSF
jgi:hypothetical protein